jgi:hypothetical protein
MRDARNETNDVQLSKWAVVELWVNGSHGACAE